MTDMSNAKIAIFSTNGFEQSELEVPRDKLRAAGATVHVLTQDGGDIKGWDGDDWGDTAQADGKITDARVEDYDALVLPGGQINPDLLRVEEDVIKTVQAFHDAGKTVAAICCGRCSGSSAADCGVGAISMASSSAMSGQ